MSVSILIITHNGIGRALLNAINQTFNHHLPLPVKTISIRYNSNPNTIVKRLNQLADNLEQGEGVLVLTDLFGSTPSNIAQRIHHHPQIQIISGLNLPMLLRIMNYPQLSLKQLAKKALSGGKKGVIQYQPRDR